MPQAGQRLDGSFGHVREEDRRRLFWPIYATLIARILPRILRRVPRHPWLALALSAVLAGTGKPDAARSARNQRPPVMANRHRSRRSGRNPYAPWKPVSWPIVRTRASRRSRQQRRDRRSLCAGGSGRCRDKPAGNHSLVRSPRIAVSPRNYMHGMAQEPKRSSASCQPRRRPSQRGTLASLSHGR
jgi:hypothetical protein